MCWISIYARHVEIVQILDTASEKLFMNVGISNF